MRTGKPAMDFVKAFNAGMLPPSRPSQNTSTASNGTGITAVSVADLLRSVDSEQSLQALFQAGSSRQSQSSSSTTKSSTPPSSDAIPSPGQLEPFQDDDMNMNLDLDSGTCSDAFVPVEPPSAGMSTTSSSAHNNNNPMHVTDFKDYFYSTTTDEPALHGIDHPYSPTFSLSIPPGMMDFDYMTQFDLADPDPARLNQIPTPTSSSGGQGSSSSSSGGVVLVDPALHQTPPQPQQKPEHDCLKVAKAIQQSVIILASKGETPMKQQQQQQQQQHDRGLAGNNNNSNNNNNTSSPLITTDQAMLMCSSISQQLAEILQCRCEADAYLPFLIAVIISKVLATYGAIAKVDDSTPFSFGSVSNPGNPRDQEKEKEMGMEREAEQHEHLNQNQHIPQHQQQQQQQQQPPLQSQPQQQQQQQDTFLAVPLRLGAYNVDSKLEGLLRSQLVLYELSKLERVVQLFSEKYCQSGPGTTALENERFGEEDMTIYSALGQFITQRYTRIKNACELRNTAER